MSEEEQVEWEGEEAQAEEEAETIDETAGDEEAENEQVEENDVSVDHEEQEVQEDEPQEEPAEAASDADSQGVVDEEPQKDGEEQREAAEEPQDFGEESQEPAEDTEEPVSGAEESEPAEASDREKAAESDAENQEENRSSAGSEHGDEHGSEDGSEKPEGSDAEAEVPEGSKPQLLGDVPETGEAAEVVLITTSLGSIRRSYYASKRAQNLLDCKEIVYVLIDSNTDMSHAKNLADIHLFKEWKDRGLLLPDPRGADVLIPQMLVDGVPVGGEIAMDDLEADADLDWIFARAACPGCLHEKSPDTPKCPHCDVAYRSIVPDEALEAKRVVQIFRGEIFNGAEEGESHFATPQSVGFNSHPSKVYDEIEV